MVHLSGKLTTLFSAANTFVGPLLAYDKTTTKKLNVSILPTGANIIFLHSFSMYKIAEVLQYMFTYQNKSESEIGT